MDRLSVAGRARVLEGEAEAGSARGPIRRRPAAALAARRRSVRARHRRRQCEPAAAPGVRPCTRRSGRDRSGPRAHPGRDGAAAASRSDGSPGCRSHAAGRSPAPPQEAVGRNAQDREGATPQCRPALEPPRDRDDDRASRPARRPHGPRDRPPDRGQPRARPFRPRCSRRCPASAPRCWPRVSARCPNRVPSGAVVSRLSRGLHRARAKPALTASLEQITTEIGRAHV